MPAAPFVAAEKNPLPVSLSTTVVVPTLFTGAPTAFSNVTVTESFVVPLTLGVFVASTIPTCVAAVPPTWKLCVTVSADAKPAGGVASLKVSVHVPGPTKVTVKVVEPMTVLLFKAHTDAVVSATAIVFVAVESPEVATAETV